MRATANRVWQEFESAERITRWFSIGHIVHQLDPQVGGKVDMSIEANEDHPGNQSERAHFLGRVLTVTPNKELTFETNFHPNPMPAPSKWTFLLSEHRLGTLIEFYHHGYEAFGEGAVDALEDLESAWNMKHLSTLRKLVEHDVSA